MARGLADVYWSRAQWVPVIVEWKGDIKGRNIMQEPSNNHNDTGKQYYNDSGSFTESEQMKTKIAQALGKINQNGKNGRDSEAFLIVFNWNGIVNK